MGGLLVLFLMVLYVWIALKIMRRVQPMWGKAVLVLAFILIPTADEIYYRTKLNAYCKHEAGFKIYQQVSKQQGLVDDSAVYPDYLELYPVKFVESQNKVNGLVRRFGRLPDESIKLSEADIFSAKYEFIRKRINTQVFLESQYSIVDRSTGKSLGSLSNLNYYGGWFQRGLLGNIADSGPTLISNCGYNETAKDSYELVKRIFSKN